MGQHSGSSSARTAGAGRVNTGGLLFALRVVPRQPVKHSVNRSRGSVRDIALRFGVMGAFLLGFGFRLGAADLCAGVAFDMTRPVPQPEGGKDESESRQKGDGFLFQ